ncbi:MAG: hypothetical protein ACHQVK_04340, partial [Candidatus Paceibacterales bacterium]
DWFLWIPFSGALIFDEKVPDEFFALTYKELELLVDKFGTAPDWSLETAYWILSFYKNVIYNNVYDLTIFGDALEQTFLHHDNSSNIIHYRHGIPPEFNKHHYRYDTPFTLGDLNPFDAIYKNNSSMATNYACGLIDEYFSA